jgi:hypothetical protein
MCARAPPLRPFPALISAHFPLISPPLPPSSHAPPTAAQCAALSALANGTRDDIGCALKRGECPSSACDLYCAFDDVTTPSDTAAPGAFNRPPPAAARLPPPPPVGTAAAGGGDGRGSGDARDAGGRDGDNDKPSGGGSSSSGGSGSGSGGIIAGVFFAVAAMGTGTYVAHKTGHLSGVTGACHDAWARLRGGAGGAHAEGFELMGDVATVEW